MRILFEVFQLFLAVRDTPEGGVRYPPVGVARYYPVGVSGRVFYPYFYSRGVGSQLWTVHRRRVRTNKRKHMMYKRHTSSWAGFFGDSRTHTQNRNDRASEILLAVPTRAWALFINRPHKLLPPHPPSGADFLSCWSRENLARAEKVTAPGARWRTLTVL